MASNDSGETRPTIQTQEEAGNYDYTDTAATSGHPDLG